MADPQSRVSSSPAGIEPKSRADGSFTPPAGISSWH